MGATTVHTYRRIVIQLDTTFTHADTAPESAKLGRGVSMQATRET